MTTATRRRFDPARDARRFVFLLDEERSTLYEVIGVRGMPAGAQPMRNAAVKVLDVAEELPDDPFAALDAAGWISIDQAAMLVVVEPMRDDG